MKNLNEYNTLNARLTILEEQNKTLKRLLSIFGLMFLLALMFAFKSADKEVEPIVRTHKLEILNDAGQTVVVLEPRETAAGLSLYNSVGKEMLFLGAEKSGEGGLFQLCDAKGKHLIQASSSPKGAALKLYDSNDKPLVYLGADRKSENSGYLNISSEGKSHIIVEGATSKIFVHNPKVESGYAQFPE